ncbi:MAG: menaquinone-dependent protoporphyrinogen IX dehydrogenase [Rhodoferax sp.]|nr:menaquinone-dependent protoporphyrinogen IX dehydrogenase [Betaproteobacteria bacterium]NCN96250.1 menaquinone-dependent protoporphyrinogen IX dehydrogenase [Rhodoferax sp.]OIP20888.1 MAG: protoporphyrinogen oxidase [Comamonadaceae bacterium CG2_30_57_122]PIZ23650.1 MAG: menaquinone-dependent protoporphyrinogen IX dehydrogenase [Comamonadaceae bacterium CG_4_10_14_0_8_um_filter_57_29]PJC14366.1 MAG: menaquinone-dependent protoporphyrinogen IX dehydrogenase [Comamonadaceae bacterium CG_4_9_14
MTHLAPQHILIAYSTTDGHTPRICARLQQVMLSLGHEVTVLPLAQANAHDLGAYQRLVIGASIRYGHHQPEVAQFIAKHQALLESRPSAFFTVNIVARKPQKNTPATNPYLIKFLRTITWKPALTGVFAGKLDYPKYGALDRLMIRFIMLITDGPTDPKTVVEFTNWDTVDAFAREVCALPR